MLYSEYLRPVNLYDTGISDQVYITIAKETPEAHQFLKMYPQAEPTVDRSGSLAVDFWADGNKQRVRIFINPRNHRPGKIFLDSNGKVTWINTLNQLRKDNAF